MADILGQILFGLFLIIAIAVVICWLWMLYDAFKYSMKVRSQSALWLVIIFFGGFIGMVVYYLVKVRNRPEEEKSKYNQMFGT